MAEQQRVRVLGLSLHGRRVGYLAGYQGGTNVLSFDPDYVADSHRATFTLTTHVDFPKAADLLRDHWVRRQRLHPVLSNLLPEGVLRGLITQQRKVHVDNEFPLFVHCGGDLPGALVAEPMAPDSIPPLALYTAGRIEPVPVAFDGGGRQFSLAGVQMKFSTRERDGRYHVTDGDDLGDWIVKTPSTQHRFVPLNEYTAMRLAEMAGVDIPDIRLVPLSSLENLPPINLPAEELAYAIRRFDRQGDIGERIHTEDFAQVLALYPHDKYERGNYDNLGKILFQFTGDRLANVQQMARRLLVNILLANGDAHLKNWCLIYADQVTPELAPAYDILSTRAYLTEERQTALNMAGVKEWYRVGLDHFRVWAARADVPWRPVRVALEDTLEKARALWPRALAELPMADEQKTILKAHWAHLQPEFRLD